MKLKKHISVFIALLLLVSNIGLAINVHYCAGSIASISLQSLQKNEDSDCCGKKIEKSTCCKDKQIKIEKKADDLVVKTTVFNLDFPFIVSSETKFVAVNRVILQSQSKLVQHYCDSNAPPLYKLYSQYVFYA